jgi:hypothetical protein
MSSSSLKESQEYWILFLHHHLEVKYIACLFSWTFKPAVIPSAPNELHFLHSFFFVAEGHFSEVVS